MIDWVDAKSRLWGMAKRRLLCSQEAYPQSFAGKVTTEGYGAIAGGHGSGHFPECFTGDALEIAIALRKALDTRRMTERQYQVFFTHYVISQPIKVKRHELGVSHSRYYELLDSAQRHIETCIATGQRTGLTA
jgi:hypothetical protein